MKSKFPIQCSECSNVLLCRQNLMLFMMFIQVKPLWQTFCIVLLFFFLRTLLKEIWIFWVKGLTFFLYPHMLQCRIQNLRWGGGENQFPKDFFLWAAVWSKIRGQQSPRAPPLNLPLCWVFNLLFHDLVPVEENGAFF